MKEITSEEFFKLIQEKKRQLDENYNKGHLIRGFFSFHNLLAQVLHIRNVTIEIETMSKKMDDELGGISQYEEGIQLIYPSNHLLIIKSSETHKVREQLEEEKLQFMRQYQKIDKKYRKYLDNLTFQRVYNPKNNSFLASILFGTGIFFVQEGDYILEESFQIRQKLNSKKYKPNLNVRRFSEFYEILKIGESIPHHDNLDTILQKNISSINMIFSQKDNSVDIETYMSLLYTRYLGAFEYLMEYQDYRIME